MVRDLSPYTAHNKFMHWIEKDSPKKQQLNHAHIIFFVCGHFCDTGVRECTDSTTK